MQHGPDAFLARLALVRAAERSIDVQYYIWQHDTTGRLLIAALLRAADRGVRVRLLIDDVGAAAERSRPADAGPASRTSRSGCSTRWRPGPRRTLGMAGDFARVNRRMHNKSLHRRQPDHHRRRPQHRRRVLRGRSGLFYRRPRRAGDRRRRRRRVGAVRSLLEQPGGVRHRRPRDGQAGRRRTARALEALRDVRAAAAGAGLRTGDARQRAGAADSGRPVSFTGAQVRVLADDPAKVEQPDGDPSKLPDAAAAAGVRPAVREQLMLISPYFVPGKDGVAFLRRIRERGVRVRVLTNSLASTDVAARLRHLPEVPPRAARGGHRALRDQPDHDRGQRARAEPGGAGAKTRTGGGARMRRCTARCWCSTAASSSSAR